MSVRKRGKNSYEIKIELGRDPATGARRQRWITARDVTKKEAEKIERDERYKIDHGIDIPPDNATVGWWLHRWLEDTASVKVRPTTLRRYRSIAKRLTLHLGDVRLQQLRPAHLQATYAALLKEGMNAQTVVHYHRLLHNALQTALRLQLIATNAADAITPPRPKPREVRALTPQEFDDLIAGMEPGQFRRLVFLTGQTGLRIGEVLALGWEHIDLERRRLRVERSIVYTPREGLSFSAPKTDAGRRTVTLPNASIEVLREQRREQLEQRMRHADVWQGEYVFCDEWGQLLKPYSISSTFSEMAEEAGLEGFTFHGLRHTHATALLRLGVSDKVAAARLGHANANVTRLIYQHVQSDLEDSVADLLDQVARGTA